MTERAPILDQLDGQWQKIAAVLLFKLSRDTPVTLTLKDFEAFREWQAIVDQQFMTWGHYDSIELRFMKIAEAQRLSEHMNAIGGAAFKGKV